MVQQDRINEIRVVWDSSLQISTAKSPGPQLVVTLKPMAKYSVESLQPSRAFFYTV